MEYRELEVGEVLEVGDEQETRDGYVKILDGLKGAVLADFVKCRRPLDEPDKPRSDWGVEELEKECFKLSAGLCVHDKGVVGDDGGSPCCPITMTRNGKSSSRPISEVEGVEVYDPRGARIKELEEVIKDMVKHLETTGVGSDNGKSVYTRMKEAVE